MSSTQKIIPFGLLITILSMLSAFAPLSIDMYLPAMSQMVVTLNTTPGHIQATVSAFFLGLAIGQIFHGPIADHFGRKPVLLAGIAIFLIATIGCIFAPNVQTLIAMRFLQAVGGSAGMLIARAIVSDMFDRKEMARTLSLMMMITVLAPICAPLIGGFIISHLHWQFIFITLLGFGLLCASLVHFYIPETLAKQDQQPLNFTHTLLTYKDLLCNPRFIVACICGALVQGSMYAYITGSEFVFTQLFGLTGQQYSFVFACGALGIIVGNFSNRQLLKYFAVEKIFRVALIVATLSGIALIFVNKTNMWLLLIPMWILIACLGFISANAAAIAMASSGKHAGSASGLIGVLQYGMGFLVSAIVAATQNGTMYPMVLTMTIVSISGSLLWFSTSALRSRSAENTD